MTPTDLAWLAGLLEGEGSFGYKRHTKSGVVYTYPLVQLGMNDEDVVARAARLMGTTYRRYAYKGVRAGTRQDRFCVQLANERARSLMIDLLPQLGARRQQKIMEVLTAAKLTQPRKAK